MLTKPFPGLQSQPLNFQPEWLYHSQVSFLAGKPSFHHYPTKPHRWIWSFLRGHTMEDDFPDSQSALPCAHHCSSSLVLFKLAPHPLQNAASLLSFFLRSVHTLHELEWSVLVFLTLSYRFLGVFYFSTDWSQCILYSQVISRCLLNFISYMWNVWWQQHIIIIRGWLPVTMDLDAYFSNYIELICDMY